MSATMRSSSAAARQRCRPEITISDGKWGAILELLAATTRVFNITDEEALEVVVNETDKLARICELYRYKMASKKLPKLKKKTKSSRRNCKCASLLPDLLIFVIAYSSHRLTANLHFRQQEHRVSPSVYELTIYRQTILIAVIRKKEKPNLFNDIELCKCTTDLGSNRLCLWDRFWHFFLLLRESGIRG